MLLFSINITLQKTIAKDITDSGMLNTTGQTASESTESLVRSIRSPTSDINETGGNRTTESSIGSGHLKGSTTENNMTNAATPTGAGRATTKTAPITIIKNANTTTISASTTPPSSSLSSLQSATDQSNISSSSILTSTPYTTNKQGNNVQNTIVRNVYTFLLANQIIPPKGSIILYDTTPYKIMNGHIAAKLPCDANSAPSLQILVGHLPSLRPIQLHLAKEFSKPGNVCMFHVGIGSTTTTAHSNNSVDKGGGGRQQDNTIINTDLVLSNPTDYAVVLPYTSTVIIGVNEIPLDIMDKG